MKKYLVIVMTTLCALNAFGQDITGQWNGILRIKTTQLRVVFDIFQTEQGYLATMDSPDQNATEIPVTSISYEESQLNVEIENLGIKYFGKAKGDSITGIFSQSGLDIPLILTRKISSKKTYEERQDLEIQLLNQYFAFFF